MLGCAVERFAKQVEGESKGELKVVPFFASQLGSEQDTVQQVARGRIDMGRLLGRLIRAGDARGGAVADAVLLPQHHRA